MPANIPEERMEDEAPENYVKRLARDKVLAVVERIRANLYPGDGQPPGQSGQLFQNELRWVVGADTVVVVDEHGKFHRFAHPAAVAVDVVIMNRLFPDRTPGFPSVNRHSRDQPRQLATITPWGR